MSFLSKLGGGLKAAAGIGASFIPGVGPTASKVLGKIGSAGDALGAIGATTSGAAKGSAQQRLAEGSQAVDYARLAQDAARDRFASNLAGSNAQFGAGLQGANFQQDERGAQQKRAIMSQLLGNTQDFKATPGNPAIAAAMGTSTGGARPSNLTTNSGALQALLAQPAISAPTYSAPTPYQAPAVPGMPTQGIGEKILGGVGLGSSILAALGQVPTSHAQPAPPPQEAFLNPDLLDPRQPRNPYAGVRF